MRAASLVALLLTALFAACSLPFSTPSRSGSLTVTVGHPRAIVADPASLTASYEVRIAPVAGGAGAQTKTGPSGSVVFSGVENGTWTVNVTARDADDKVLATGEGSVTVGSGSNSVPITLHTTQSGTGAFQFVFRFPESTGVTYVKATLYDLAGAQVGATWEPSLTTSGGDRSGVIGRTGVDSGYYRLELVFRRGGVSGTVAAILSEAVNIWDNCISDQWLRPDGTMADERVFDASEFSSASTALASLAVQDASGTALNLTPSFSSATTSYALSQQMISGPTVRLTPAAALDGQRIQYQSAAGAWVDITSGSSLPDIAVTGAYTFRIKVTAPDAATTDIYEIAAAAANLTLSFSGNSHTAGSAPTEPRKLQSGATISLPGPGSLQRLDYNFAGWNTAANGTGTTYFEGSSFTVTASTTLYALWVSDQLILAGGVIVGYEDPPIGTLVIPEGVTGIAPYAFDGTSVTAVQLPSTLTNLGYGAFAYCSSLTSVNIPAGVTTLGWITFDHCESLTTVTFDPGSQLQYIGDSAFAYAHNLTSVTIPASVQVIDVYAFFDCSKLSSLTFESGSQLAQIRSYAFQGCAQLTSVTLPDSLNGIGPAAFRGAGLQTLTLGSGLSIIEFGAFQDCHALTSVILPYNLYYLGDMAFGYCYLLTSVTMNPTYPPYIYGDPFFNTHASLQISVPAASYALYGVDSSWSIYAARIITH